MNCWRAIGWSPISRRLLELLEFLLSTNSYWSPNKTGISPGLSPRQCTGAGSDFFPCPHFTTQLLLGGLPYLINVIQAKSYQRSISSTGPLINPNQTPLRTRTNPYFALKLAPNPLIRVSSHYPLLHPPTNSFWYRIGTELVMKICRP